MPNYTKRKHFTIHRNDAGTEAYRDEYVRWLEDRVKQMTDAVKRRGFDFVCVGTAAMELTRDFRPNIAYSGDPIGGEPCEKKQILTDEQMDEIIESVMPELRAFWAGDPDAIERGFSRLSEYKAAIEEYGKWTCETSSRTQS